MPTRAVFDCMVFLQAITSPRGPAFACFEMVDRGEVDLLISDPVLWEIEDVLNRPVLRAKFTVLSDELVTKFLAKVRGLAILVPSPPKAFSLPRDPKDEPYSDLAIAGAAEYLVSWNDRHLGYLMRQDTPEGRQYCSKFPNLKIVTPPRFLERVRAT